MRFCKCSRSIYWVYLLFSLSLFLQFLPFLAGVWIASHPNELVTSSIFGGVGGCAPPFFHCAGWHPIFFVFTVMLFVFVALKHGFFFDSEFARNQDTTQHYSQMGTWGIWVKNYFLTPHIDWSQPFVHQWGQKILDDKNLLRNSASARACPERMCIKKSRKAACPK